jgi:hypothetical protein
MYFNGVEKGYVPQCTKLDAELPRGMDGLQFLPIEEA